MRPKKLTPEVSEKIIQALSQGNYQDTAAAYAGIHPATYFRWMNDAEKEDAPPELCEFRDAVLKARARAEIRNVTLIQNSANGGAWQAAAWWLERSAPAR